MVVCGGLLLPPMPITVHDTRPGLLLLVRCKTLRVVGLSNIPREILWFVTGLVEHNLPLPPLKKSRKRFLLEHPTSKYWHIRSTLTPASMLKYQLQVLRRGARVNRSNCPVQGS